MTYTVSQASDAAGVSKSTVLRAIKSGKLSAMRGENAEWLIDPAELHRVYSVRHDAPNTTSVTHHDEVLKREVELLREQIELLKSERNDLRRRLDDESAERRKLTTMLTHQPTTTPEPTAAPQPPAKAEEGGLLAQWWRKLV